MSDTKAVGRTIPLSIPRRIMCDLLAHAKTIPTVPVQKQMNLAGLVATRARLADRPGWCAIFTKAYALTAQRFPELRRSYKTYPWPHLYEHPFSIASIAIEREYEGENAVFWGHLRRPEEASLHMLQTQLRRYKDEPLRNFGLFRRVLLMGRLPGPVRRLAWWIGRNCFPGRRVAGFLGTFGVSVYSGLGAESLHPISPLTTTLNYGTIADDGGVSVRIVYDHRVLDGATVARALGCLEDILNREIRAELAEHAARAA